MGSTDKRIQIRIKYRQLPEKNRYNQIKSNQIWAICEQISAAANQIESNNQVRFYLVVSGLSDCFTVTVKSIANVPLKLQRTGEVVSGKVYLLRSGSSLFGISHIKNVNTLKVKYR